MKQIDGIIAAKAVYDQCFLFTYKSLEAISKCSIGLKIKAGRGGQPQTYIEYFEDWTLRPNADIEFEGTF